MNTSITKLYFRVFGHGQERTPRYIRFTFLISMEEKELINAMAEFSKQPASEFIRNSVFNEIKRIYVKKFDF
jgi:hypothetical protein